MVKSASRSVGFGRFSIPNLSHTWNGMARLAWAFITLSLLTACGMPPVENHAPAVRLASRKQATVGDRLILGALVEDVDKDTHHYLWELRAPKGSTAEIQHVDPDVVHVDTDVTGLWQFTVTVSDGELTDSETRIVPVLGRGER